MKKQGKHWLLIIGIIALLLIISLVLFAVFGAGLSKEEAKEYIDADWLQKTSTQEEQPSYLSLLDQRSNYTVDSIAKEDNYYVVTVTVSAPDVKKYLIENSVHLLENIDDFDALIYDCVEAASIADTVANIYIYEKKR